jgi:D-alanine--poly(phosphoribitol) ligase subunit 2
VKVPQMVRSEVIELMQEMFLFQLDEEVNEHADLFKAGIMDSYGYLRLMRGIQDKYGIAFTREELLSNIITSVSGLVEAVEAKLR